MKKPIGCAQQGFTILELMIVITLMIVINGIILTGVMSYLSASRQQEVQAKMAMLVADLDSQWRFKQTFAGYRNVTVKVPKSSYILPYTVTIYDRDTGGSLTSSSAIGKRYAIVAIPEDKKSAAFYVDELGVQCTNNIPSQVTYEGCGTSGSNTW